MTIQQKIELMNYLIKKNPDATIKDWIEAMKDIIEERSELENRRW